MRRCAAFVSLTTVDSELQEAIDTLSTLDQRLSNSFLVLSPSTDCRMTATARPMAGTARPTTTMVGAMTSARPATNVTKARMRGTAAPTGHLLGAMSATAARLTGRCPA